MSIVLFRQPLLTLLLLLLTKGILQMCRVLFLVKEGPWLERRS